LHFQDQMSLQRRWSVNGRQYARTCEAWLDNVDSSRRELLQMFAASDSPDPPAVMLQRWRMFFMACAELFRYRDGAEWYVSHYLFARNPANGQPTRRSDSRSFCAAISQ
jgi:cyclopropane-fatty-acyl-phospholipid synthase